MPFSKEFIIRCLPNAPDLRVSRCRRVETHRMEIRKNGAHWSDAPYQRIAYRFTRGLASPDETDVPRHAWRERRAHAATSDAYVAVGIVPQCKRDDRCGS